MKLKDAARRIRDDSRTSIQRFFLRRHLLTLDRALAGGQAAKSRTMNGLVRAWGNEAWSTGVPLLTAMLEWLPRTSEAIVECGSGLSTLVLASAALRLNRKLTSLEHDSSWAARVNDHLPAQVRTHVDIAITPLKDYGEFDWYSLDAIAMPKQIGFVLCDGPPGMTRGGRYGLAPILRSRLAPGCIILLDDTQRSEEQAIANRWCKELSASVVFKAETFTVLSVA
jgi:hypothetical protein